MIVYLFVFGELCDAYQNQQIGHDERIQLVLRAKLFLQLWERYLAHVSDGKKHLHFISREAVDICDFLIHGPVSLILVHCDFIPETFPLLPWRGL